MPKMTDFNVGQCKVSSILSHGEPAINCVPPWRGWAAHQERGALLRLTGAHDSPPAASPRAKPKPQCL